MTFFGTNEDLHSRNVLQIDLIAIVHSETDNLYTLHHSMNLYQTSRIVHANISKAMQLLTSVAQYKDRDVMFAQYTTIWQKWQAKP